MAKTKPKGFSPARKFAWNTETQTEGLWREIDDGAAKLKIARFNNPEHQAYLRRLREENAKLLENPDSEESQTKLNEIASKAMAAHILKDWEGIQDEEGNDLPYSKEAAYQLLSDYEEFSNLVFSLSTDVEQYRKYKEADAVKN
jgi:hypothetical protein